VQSLVGIFATFVCLLVASPTQADQPYTSSQASLKISDGLVWLEVHVSGRAEPLHFVLDTGAGVTVLNSLTAKELDLKPGQKLSVRGTQGKAPARWMKGFAASIASVSLPDQVLALDLSEVSNLCHRRIDGLLGADFLRGHQVQLDFGAKVMRLDTQCEKLGPDTIAIPIEQRNDAWCASVAVNESSPCWLRIDTGFDGAMSWWPGTDKSSAEVKSSTVAISVGGTSHDQANIQMEALTVDAVRTAVLSRPLFARESGLIGLELLSKYRLTFEVDQRRMFVEPAGN